MDEHEPHSDGEAPSFDEILEHQPFIQRLASSLAGGDESQADDLTQDLWLAALKTPPRNKGTLRVWISRVLRNRATATIWRKKDWRDDSGLELSELPSKEGDDSVRQEEARVAHERVRAAIEALPEGYRTVLGLRIFEELNPQDIASKTSQPLNTIKTRLQRGRKLMYAELMREEQRERRGLSAIFAMFRRGAPARKQALAGVVAFALLATALGIWWPFGSGGELSSGENTNVLVSGGGLDEVDSDVRDAPRVPISANVEVASLQVTFVLEQGGIPYGDSPVELIWSEDGSSKKVTTDDNGTIELEGLQPGSWTLNATAYLSHSLVLEPGPQVVELTIPMLRKLQVTVAGEDGASASGSRIELVPWGQGELVAVGETDSSGQLSTWITPGFAYLHSRDDEGLWSDLVRIEANDSTPRVRLELVQRVHHLLRIVDERGMPVPGAIVRRGDHKEDVFRKHFNLSGKGSNQRSGKIDVWPVRADLDGLARVPLKTHASPNGMAEDVLVTATQYAPTRVTLPGKPAPEMITVSLGAGRVITGVVSAPDGQPAQGVDVKMSYLGLESHQRQQTQSAADGSFEFRGVAETKVLLRALRNVRVAFQEVDMATQGTQPVSLKLKAVARKSIPIRLVGQSGQRFDGVRVRATHLMKTMRPQVSVWEWGLRGVQVETDTAGQGTLMLPPKFSSRENLVWAEAWDSTLNRRSAMSSAVYSPLTGRQEFQLNVDPRLACTLEGQLVSAVASKRIAINAWSRERGYSLGMDEDCSGQHFRFSGIEAGRWTLLVDGVSYGEYLLEPGAKLDLGPLRPPEMAQVVFELEPNHLANLTGRLQFAVRHEGQNAILKPLTREVTLTELLTDPTVTFTAPAGEYTASIAFKNATPFEPLRRVVIEVEPGEVRTLTYADMSTEPMFGFRVVRLNSDALEAFKIRASFEGKSMQEWQHRQLGIGIHAYKIPSPSDRGEWIIQAVSPSGEILAELKRRMEARNAKGAVPQSLLLIR